MTTLLLILLLAYALHVARRPRPRRKRRVGVIRRVARAVRKGWQRRHSERYDAYMGSAAWKAKKREAFEWHGRACQVCGSQRNLECHHLHYRTLTKERMKDLRILCKPCHQAADTARRQKARWF